MILKMEVEKSWILIDIYKSSPKQASVYKLTLRWAFSVLVFSVKK